MSNKVRFHIASPCSENWNDMVGNDRVRFCSHCAKHVHNVSAMTRKDAERLVASSDGRLCMRYEHHAGTIVHREAPPPAFVPLRRVSRLAAGVFGLALSVSHVAAQEAPAEPVPVVERQQDESVPSGTTVTTIPLPDRSTALVGIVRDQAGAAIPGAIVELVDATGNSRKKTTDRDGVYLFDSVEAGSVRIVVTAEGFARQSADVDVVPEHLTDAQTVMAVEGTSMVKVPQGMKFQVLGGAVAISRPSKTFVLHDSERTERPPLPKREREYLEKFLSDMETVEKLLKAGMPVNLKNEYGDTLLMLAISDRDAVRRLLWHGADADAKNEFGATPLMFAVSNFDSKIVKLLLAHGASLDARENTGKTALMLAAIDGNETAVKLLLKSKASVNLRDKDKKTALGYALEGEQEEIAAMLKAAGGRQ